jgi:hypothetical protein
MTHSPSLILVSFTLLFLAACGGESDNGISEPAPVDDSISFIEACHQHCDFSHDAPEDCPADLTESLNSCFLKCAAEDEMDLSESCESTGVAFYTCTQTLSFICTEGRTDPTPANLSDCSLQSGEWNACLLGG